jgi:hypothetical protein
VRDGGCNREKKEMQQRFLQAGMQEGKNNPPNNQERFNEWTGMKRKVGEDSGGQDREADESTEE